MPAGNALRTPGSVDVCVIGSGPAGAMAAHELARGGHRVLLLEEGTAARPGDSLRTLEPRWPAALARSADGMLTPAGRPWSARALGGGTSIFAGMAFRLRHVDFDAAAHAAAGALDPRWPIGYQDLRDCYDEVERVIGVARRAGADPMEPDGGPARMPPLPYSTAGALLARAGSRLGLRPFPTPLAVATVPYRGRPACHRCGPCNEYACPTGAKASAADLLLPPLAGQEALAVCAGSRALRIVLASAHRAAGVEWLDLSARQRRTTAARVVVLAANAVQSAAILLRSACRQAPRGLGNRHDMVGRIRLRLHCLAADQPMPGNRVRLAASTDQDGAAKIIMEYRTHRADAARLKYLACKAERILREAGASGVTEQPSGYQLGSRHLHGTCRAGSDPRTCVVDRWGVVHGTDNVYVVDGGYFPYAGGVNPFFTIQANALRISAEIARRLGGGTALRAAAASRPAPAAAARGQGDR